MDLKEAVERVLEGAEEMTTCGAPVDDAMIEKDLAAIEQVREFFALEFSRKERIKLRAKLCGKANELDRKLLSEKEMSVPRIVGLKEASRRLRMAEGETWRTKMVIGTVLQNRDKARLKALELGRKLVGGKVVRADRYERVLAAQERLQDFSVGKKVSPKRNDPQ